MSDCKHSPTVRLFAAMNDDCPVCLRSRLAEVERERNLLIRDLSDAVSAIDEWAARLAEAEEALREIADMDWRGNCPPAVIVAIGYFNRRREVSDE